MAEYRIVIRVDGEGNAQGFLGGVGGALGNVAQITAGGVIAGSIMGIGNAIGGTIGEALEATKQYENMGLSLEGLVARELKNASGIERTIVLGKEKIQLTGKEIGQIGALQQKLTDETLQRTTLGARIQEQKEHIRQLTQKYGENGLVVIKETARLAEMENAYNKSGAAINKYGSQIGALEGKQGKLVDVTQKVIEGQLSMTEALAQAGPKAKDLLNWIQQLAIASPFKQSDIAGAFQLGMAYGFTTDEAKKLTSQLVDFSAVMDPTGGKMNLIAYALGQIHNSGTLMTQDLRQLMSAGVDVNAILAKMGFTLKDVGKSSISSKAFLKAFSDMMDSDFAGAAARSSGTLTGLLSSLEDIKGIGLRNLFEGAFGALKPLLQGTVTMLSSPAFLDGLRGVGTGIGQGVKTAIGWIQMAITFVQRLWNSFQAGKDLGLSPLRAILFVLGMLRVPPVLLSALNFVFMLFENIGTAAGRFFGLFQAGLALGFTPLESLRNTLAILLPPAIFAALQSFFDLLNRGGVWLTTVLIPTLLALLPQLIAFAQNGLGQIGAVLTGVLPNLRAFTGWIVGTLIPALLQFAAVAGPQLGAGLNLIGFWLQQIFVWGQQVAMQALPLLAQGLPLLAQGFQWVGNNMQIVAPVLGVIALGLGLILAPVIALPALLVVLATAWANNWGNIQGTMATVWAILQPILAGLIGFITGQLVPGVILLAAWMGTNVPLAIQNLQMAIQNLNPFWELVRRGVSAAISILTSLSAIWQSLNRIVDEFRKYLINVILQFLRVDQSAQAVEQRMNSLQGVLNMIGGVINWFIESILKELNREFAALVSWLEEAAKLLGQIADALANLHLPGQFERHSPSPFEQMLMNANVQLREMSELLPRSLGALGGYGLPSFAPQFAGAGAGGFSSPSYDNRRQIQISGPIYIQANDVREFEKSLDELGERVYGEGNFIG